MLKFYTPTNLSLYQDHTVSALNDANNDVGTYIEPKVPTSDDTDIGVAKNASLLESVGTALTPRKSRLVKLIQYVNAYDIIVVTFGNDI